GFFINPNDFSFWGALAFWAALSFLRGPRRLIAAGASLASLALGQSRGSLASWILTVVLWPIARCLMPRKSANTAKLLRYLVFVGLIGDHAEAPVDGEQKGPEIERPALEKGPHEAVVDEAVE